MRAQNDRDERLMRADFESLQVDVDELGVLTCVLNRPEKLNAITAQDMKDLGRLWAEVADDESVKAIVITGSGQGFCAGGDVSGMLNGDFEVKDLALAPFASAAWERLAAVPQPVIAAINGTTTGVGLFFAGLADIVLSVETARFGDPHVKIGLVAVGGGIFAPSIGLRHTKYLLLTGELISADEAQRIGLVNRIVVPDALVPEAIRLAHQLASYPEEALRWTKKCLNRLLEQSWQVGWDAEVALEAASATTASHREAVERFQNR